MQFRILTVCSGNICRSPQAEQLLRAGFTSRHNEASAWEIPIVSSAGTRAMLGGQMPSLASDLSVKHGGDPSRHSPRQVTREIIERSDLIVALAREHRSAVARLSPPAARVTFTLRELARILDTYDALGNQLTAANSIASSRQDPFKSLLTFASGHRGYVSASVDDDNVVDPFGRSDATYYRSIAQILPSVSSIINALDAFSSFDGKSGM